MKRNAHRSLPKVSAARSRASEDVFKLANAAYKKGLEHERKGERAKATQMYRKAQRLMQKASRAGLHLLGPVGRLPNPKSKTVIIDYNGDEFDIDDGEAFALGTQAARAIGRTERDRKALPRYWKITYYSPMRGKTVGFIRPIQAHSATDARKQAKAMVTNDPKASNFVAREVRRNPKAFQGTGGRMICSECGRNFEHVYSSTYCPDCMAKRHPKIEKRAREYVKETGMPIGKARELAVIAIETHDKRWPNPGIIDLAANLQAADYVRQALGAGKRKRNNGAFSSKYDNESEAYQRGFYDGSRGFTQGVYYPDHVKNEAYKAGKRDGLEAKRKLTNARKRKKRNPSLRSLSETFQGKASGAAVELKAANSAPSNLARIGKLVFIKLSGSGKQTRVPGAMVAVDQSGKLWLAANRAPMFKQKAKSNQMLDFGPLDSICYETAKAHIENGKLTEYVHKFGEDGGKRPHLLIDHEGMPILRGGDYKIKAEGIVN